LHNQPQQSSTTSPSTTHQNPISADASIDANHPRPSRQLSIKQRQATLHRQPSLEAGQMQQPVSNGGSDYAYSDDRKSIPGSEPQPHNNYVDSREARLTNKVNDVQPVRKDSRQQQPPLHSHTNGAHSQAQQHITEDYRQQPPSQRHQPSAGTHPPPHHQTPSTSHHNDYVEHDKRKISTESQPRTVGGGDRSPYSARKNYNDRYTESSKQHSPRTGLCF
jgi:hypothetical protein